MMMDIHQTELANGIRVATSAFARVRSVALGVWVGVGARYETRALAGISHFIEHLLFKGTARLSARDISQAIEGRGGFCNAFTQEELTCYYARTADNHTWKALAILTEMFRHPRFAPADIEKERGVIIEEIMMYRDQPEQVVQEMLNAALWQDHCLGRPLIGYPETLRGLGRQQILSFKNQKYVPQKTVFVFAGHVKHEECVRQVEKLMRGVVRAREPGYQRVSAAVPQERLALKAKDIEQTQLALGFRIFGRNDSRRYALKLLNVILGENMSSRLFQVVREKHALAYAIHSSAQLFAETGDLVISAGLDRKRDLKALELIVREIQRLKRRPISPPELQRAKEYVLGQIRLGLESPAGHMMWVGDHVLNYGKVITPEELLAAIQAVQAEDIQELANAIFRERRTSLAWLARGSAGCAGEHLKELLAEI
ncbi:MAG: insulinase family protein [Lentisphaerae bacterium]|nr:insulinase family protein [Lentisphaerota bacterium]